MHSGTPLRTNLSYSEVMCALCTVRIMICRSTLPKRFTSSILHVLISDIVVYFDADFTAIRINDVFGVCCGDFSNRWSVHSFDVGVCQEMLCIRRDDRVSIRLACDAFINASVSVIAVNIHWRQRCHWPFGSGLRVIVRPVQPIALPPRIFTDQIGVLDVTSIDQPMHAYV